MVATPDSDFAMHGSDESVCDAAVFHHNPHISLPSDALLPRPALPKTIFADTARLQPSSSSSSSSSASSSSSSSSSTISSSSSVFVDDRSDSKSFTSRLTLAERPHSPPSATASVGATESSNTSSPHPVPASSAFPHNIIMSTVPRLWIDTSCKPGPSDPTSDSSQTPTAALSSTMSPSSSAPPAAHFDSLPVEIHEAILDYIFGALLPAAHPSKQGFASSSNKAFRHPRRKDLSNLALVSPVWRPLVQKRIYRHIQLKGTVDVINESSLWFSQHPHLSQYVRHIEIWVPVLGDRTLKPISRREDANSLLNVAREPTTAGNQALAQGGADVSAPSFDMPQYVHSSDSRHHSRNATLQQLFRFVAVHCANAKIFTLEGGHCKKPPMITHFNSPYTPGMCFDTLPNIHTFVMRGAWNLMREEEHWHRMASALPNLREWQCAFVKPKPKACATLGKVLTHLPTTRITCLNISLEGFYKKKSAAESRWWLESPDSNDLQLPPHLCRLLGAVLPQLESLTLTGRVCHTLFTVARAAMLKKASMTSRRVESRLRSVDIVVKSCCRNPNSELDPPLLQDLSGVTNGHFITAFERFVLSAVQSLDVFDSLNDMRIRFIDLDSEYRMLDPYFELRDRNNCTGIWSEAILAALQQARPTARYEALEDGIRQAYTYGSHHPLHHHHHGHFHNFHHPHHHHHHHHLGAVINRFFGPNIRVCQRTRPRSIKTSSYKLIVDKSLV